MPHRITGATPRQLAERAKYATITTGAASAAILTAWTAGVLPDARLVLAIYLTTSMMAMGLGCVVMLARCHLAIATAFTAGFHSGQSARLDADTIQQADVRRMAAASGEPRVRLVK